MSASDPEKPAPQDAHSAVIACALTGDDLGRQAKRWQQLRAWAGRERIETADGLRLIFLDAEPAEDELRSLVAVENACCSWARWEISRADGTLVMDARSTGDGVAALHGMFVDDESARPKCCEDC
jgi:hypothetical protein